MKTAVVRKYARWCGGTAVRTASYPINTDPFDCPSSDPEGRHDWCAGHVVKLKGASPKGAEMTGILQPKARVFWVTRNLKAAVGKSLTRRTETGYKAFLLG